MGKVHACVCAKLLQLCSTLCGPMDYSLPGFSVHGILQARILEWVAMPSSRGSPDLRIKPAAPVPLTLQADSLPLSHLGNPKVHMLRFLLTHAQWKTGLLKRCLCKVQPYGNPSGNPWTTLNRTC